MGRQPAFFDLADRLEPLSAKGDDLERIARVVDFEMFRAELDQAVPRSDGSKGGRPAVDRVLMFKILLLQAMQSLSDKRCEYLVRDRLGFKRFLGLGLVDPVPDANTTWMFREALKIAVPAFGYKNHVLIDRRQGVIRRWTVTDAASHDGVHLATVIDTQNTASGVWADTVYRLAKNEAWLAERGLVSRITERSRTDARWLPEPGGQAQGNPPCARLSSTFLHGRKARWRWSCASSASPERR